MELTNEFTVPLPPDRAWGVLTDLERIAPCLPGARLTEVEGDDHRGEVKVKVGPITATYKGVARFVERDEAAGRAILRAEGRDARQGSATALVTATLAPEGAGTKVTVVTDVTVAGKVAQFGRGVLADISVKLLDQFADCLDEQLKAEHAATAPAEGSAPPSPAVQEFARAVVEASPPEERPAAASVADAPRRIEAPEPEPVDLLGTAGAPVARRLLPVGVASALVVLVLLLLRRRRR
jgi:carbon monoxide dehydrogenase subunit G